MVSVSETIYITRAACVIVESCVHVTRMTCHIVWTSLVSSRETPNRHTTMPAVLTSPAAPAVALALATRGRPSPRRLAPARALPPHVSVQYAPEYGDPKFDEDTRNEFNSGEEFVADVEQARVLWDDGWDVLDVRAAQEIEHFGKFPNPPPGTIGGVFETIVVSGPHKVKEIPLITSTGYRFDPSANAKVFQNKTKNAEFMTAVRKNFPDTDTAKIMVTCSDGRQRAVAVLEMLEDAGYKNLVLLQGGYTLYNRHWSSKLNRRLPNGAFKTDWNAPGDIQGLGVANPEFGNSDGIMYGSWKDATDWKTTLA